MGEYFSTPERNIVLIGNTGNGKSSAGNMILNTQAFITKASANPVTTKCQRIENMVYGEKITVIDTPDFFDVEDENEENIKSEIVRALIECAGGIHAFVIVLKVGKYTTNEKRIVKQLLDTLTEEVWKHTVILFTFGEQLEGQDIKEFVKTNSQLQEIVKKCDVRCHVIDNKHWSKLKKKKVKEKLLETIDKMVERHKFYSNELLQKVEEQIQEEMKRNTPEEAKNTVHRTFLRRLGGAATGALVGAFLGVRDDAVSELQKRISESLENLVVPFVEKSIGAAAAFGVRCVTGGLVKGAVGGLVSGWNAEDADAACDGRSKAALTNYEHAITLMKKAQTELETAKHTLETATTVLQHK